MTHLIIDKYLTTFFTFHLSAMEQIFDSNNLRKSYNQCQARCGFSLFDTQFSFTFFSTYIYSNQLLFIELNIGCVWRINVC